jgi:hypothetical protein
VELSINHVSFTVPSDYKLIFVESGQLFLRLQTQGSDVVDITARVSTLAPGEGHHLYVLEFVGVDNPEAHRAAIDVLQATLN